MAAGVLSTVLITTSRLMAAQLCVVLHEYCLNLEESAVSFIITVWLNLQRTDKSQKAKKDWDEKDHVLKNITREKKLPTDDWRGSIYNEKQKVKSGQIGICPPTAWRYELHSQFLQTIFLQTQQYSDLQACSQVTVLITDRFLTIYQRKKNIRWLQLLLWFLVFIFQHEVALWTTTTKNSNDTNRLKFSN